MVVVEIKFFNDLSNKIFDPVLREVSSNSLHLFRVELNWLYVKV
jgi:hypothetical protein